MNTNAGAETMNKATIGFTNKREQGDEMGDIKRLFTPEFRNRLDAIVNFKALDQDIILRVVDKFLLQLEGQLAEKKVEVTFTDALRKFLGKKGFDPLMGARPMQRLIQDTIRRALADELLFGRLVDGGRLTVDIDAADAVLLDIQPPKRTDRPLEQRTPVLALGVVSPIFLTCTGRRKPARIRRAVLTVRCPAPGPAGSSA
jgi:ATP-dependent Clp protease ATP-binding subunit ClpA